MDNINVCSLDSKFVLLTALKDPCPSSEKQRELIHEPGVSFANKCMYVAAWLAA
jgi:hypothetical protein